MSRTKRYRTNKPRSRKPAKLSRSKKDFYDEFFSGIIDIFQPKADKRAIKLRVTKK